MRPKGHRSKSFQINELSPLLACDYHEGQSIKINASEASNLSFPPVYCSLRTNQIHLQDIYSRMMSQGPSSVNIILGLSTYIAIQVVVSGYVVFCVVMHGNEWLRVVISGYVWLL